MESLTIEELWAFYLCMMSQTNHPSISAKTNQNVEQVFFTIARDIKQRLTETVAAAAEPPTIQISRPDPDQPNPASRWSSCCNS
nr:unnamed protein product [Digitaria exilis]